jgi:Cdc6-like AAA superfamily ATPase
MTTYGASSSALSDPYNIGKHIVNAIHLCGGASKSKQSADLKNSEYIQQIDQFIQSNWGEEKLSWEDQLTILVDAMVHLDSKQAKIPALYEKLKITFEKLPVEKVDEFLQKIAFEGVKENIATLHCLALSLISYDRLHEVMEHKEKEYSDGGYKDISEIASDVAKYHTSPPQSKVKKSFYLEVKRSLSFVLNFIPNLISTFLIAFSLYDIGKDPQSAWEASAMLDVYYKFFMIPAALVVILKVFFPAVGLSVYAMAAGIIALAIVALVIYIKWFQPCPNNLPHCYNLTQDVELGYQSPVIGREKEIDRLVKMFSSLDNNTASHALLVGPTGVGKTEIVKGLAQRIIQGKKDIPKSLRNKKVFLINTASLVQGGMFGYADQMKFLLNRIKGHENEAIFFFDEFHVAAREKKLADYLKQELNRGRIHVIAATTTEEYQKCILPDEALDRRFEKIYVSDMDDVNVKEVLQSIVRETTKCVFVDDQMIDLIIQKTKEVMEQEKVVDDKVSEALDEIVQKTNEVAKRHQPWFSVQVLTSAMNKVASSIDSHYIPPALTKKKSLLKSLKLALNADSSFRITTKEGREKLKAIRTLEVEIARDEIELKVKRKQIEKFQTLRKEMQDRHHNLKKSAKNVLKGKKKQKEKGLKNFYWEYEYLIPQLSKVLDEVKSEINTEDFKIVVDEELIDEVIQQLLDNGKKITS